MTVLPRSFWPAGRYWETLIQSQNQISYGFSYIVSSTFSLNSLAWILKYCVEEFKESEIADIRDRYIIGTPEVALTPVLPDQTNAASHIRGESTEDATLTEGRVTFDIRFRAVTPEEDPLELIINVEAQRSSHLTYPLMKRAVYYCSRLISSQYTVDFEKAHYEGVKKVYSIWLCMDTPDGASGITRYRLTENQEYGAYREDRRNYDLLQVVMVYIGQGKRELGNRLLNLLEEIFKSKDSAKDKRERLQKEYQIDLNEEEEGMVDTMCNLSVGIFERAWNQGVTAGFAKGREEGLEKGLEEGHAKGLEEGRAKGREEGREEGRAKGREEGRKELTRAFVMQLLEMHMPLSFILQATKCNEKEIRDIAEEEGLTVDPS